MNFDELYRKLRKHGLCSDEAAALLGYALLARQIGWKELPVSHHHRRKIERTFAKVGIVPHDVRCESAEQEHQARRDWNADRVVLSGRTS